jgi:hypothetical protein
MSRVAGLTALGVAAFAPRRAAARDSGAPPLMFVDRGGVIVLQQDGRPVTEPTG